MGQPPTGGKRGGIPTPLEITPELANQVAEFVAGQKTTNDIIRSLKLSYPSVRKIMRSPEFVAEIKAMVRTKVAGLTGKMVDVLERQLEEGNLEAVKLGFKVLGAVDPEPIQQGGNQSIQVILPGAGPSMKEVVSESSESSRDGANQEI